MRKLVIIFILFACDDPDIVPDKICWTCEAREIVIFGPAQEQQASFAKWDIPFCNKSQSQIDALEQSFYVAVEGRHREMKCKKIN